ncbi:MAG TPA: 2-oxo acid dehydrogenase subunit E2, partial [Kaistella chaponensis]
MMYVAMSYDHRIIDGKESVGFLVAVKEGIDNPVEFLMGGDEKKALEL